jgi:hypothetical protein
VSLLQRMAARIDSWVDSSKRHRNAVLRPIKWEPEHNGRVVGRNEFGDFFFIRFRGPTQFRPTAEWELSISAHCPDGKRFCGHSAPGFQTSENGGLLRCQVEADRWVNKTYPVGEGNE